MDIFLLNAGSSSLKFALFTASADGETLWLRGSVERIGSEEAQLKIAGRDPLPVGAESLPHAAEQIFGMLRDGKLADTPVTPEAVACRVVHGGGKFTSATRVSPDILQAIRDLAPLAPLHNPAEADILATSQKLLPSVPVVAVFDTAFHHTLPPVAYSYALPADLTEKFSLRRYGFHGVSHRYVSGELLRRLNRTPNGTRLITCHLGNGSSVCALRDGKSVDTSMGLTPLEGLVMGTRSGDLDPGLVLYLLRETGQTPQELDDILNHKSGLLGLSGTSADVRDLEKAAQSGDAKAELALAIFAYRVRKYIGAYAAALGGLDAIAFTGGIGEHSASVRERICRSLEFLGVALEPDANRQANGSDSQRIHAGAAQTAVWVIPTDEERQMARETFTLLQ